MELRSHQRSSRTISTTHRCGLISGTRRYQPFFRRRPLSPARLTGAPLCSATGVSTRGRTGQTRPVGQEGPLSVTRPALSGDVFRSGAFDVTPSLRAVDWARPISSPSVIERSGRSSALFFFFSRSEGKTISCEYFEVTSTTACPRFIAWRGA